MSFAARLKKLRLKNAQSLQQAADAVGISKAHFWELEQGTSKNPSIELLQRLAEHYKITVTYLIGEERGADEGADQWALAMFKGLKGVTDPSDRKIIELLLEKQKAKG